MFFTVIGDEAERRKHRYFDEREPNAGRSEEHFGHQECRYMRHDEANKADKTQCNEHAALVSDARDEGGNQERCNCNWQVFERLQNAGGGLSHLVAALYLQNNRADTVKQDREHEVVDEQRKLDGPVFHGGILL